MGPRQTRRKELLDIWAAGRREPERLVLVASVLFFDGWEPLELVEAEGSFPPRWRPSRPQPTLTLHQAPRAKWRAGSSVIRCALGSFFPSHQAQQLRKARRSGYPQAERMPSLLVLIFVIELAVQLINSIGAATINTLVRSVLALPHQTSP